MRRVCFEFIRTRLIGLALDDGGNLFDIANVFELEAPRDFFKDNDFGAIVQIPQDRKKRDGSVVSRVKDVVAENWTITKRTHMREMLFRVAVQAKYGWQLWGKEGFTGLVDQFEAAVAGFRGLEDSSGFWTRCELVDAIRPWGESGGRIRQDRDVRKPRKAVVRVKFSGGIYITETVGWIPEITITPTMNGGG